jgi:hypothetical protein
MYKFIRAKKLSYLDGNKRNLVTFQSHRLSWLYGNEREFAGCVKVLTFSSRPHFGEVARIKIRFI